jgi:hypothetical protein
MQTTLAFIVCASGVPQYAQNSYVLQHQGQPFLDPALWKFTDTAIASDWTIVLKL